MPGHRLPSGRHASGRMPGATGAAGLVAGALVLVGGFALIGLHASAADAAADSGSSLNAAALTAHHDLVTGTYTGAGLTLAADAAGGVAVRDVVAGSPAAASGLRVGDVVVKVADSDVTGSHTSQIARMLRGSPESNVAVVVRRGNDDVDVSLTRTDVSSRDVHVRDLADGTRVIRVDRFSAEVGEHVALAVSAAPKANGFVLDLRSNPGGLVAQATSVASVFLNAGTVARLDAVAGDEDDVVLRTSTRALTAAPLVVLVDSGSASAAELLTGALQDRGRAVVVGARTFGKGTVQMVSQRDDTTGTLSTLAHYTTPDGHVVDQVGIAPDVLLSDPVSDSLAFTTATGILAGLV